MATIWPKASWWMNDWGDPVSSRAQERNRDVAEAVLDRDSEVVNVTSSIVTTSVIKSGSCSGTRGSSVLLMLAKRTSGA